MGDDSLDVISRPGFVAIAKDATETLWHDSMLAERTDKCPRHDVLLEGLVKPCSLTSVCISIAQKGSVFERRALWPV
jgi:hypothetical protein